MEATHESIALADGDLPRDLAHSLDSQLMDVVTLLSVARREASHLADTGEDGSDGEGMTDAASRAAALIEMADRKVRDVVRAMAPYV